MAEKTTGDVLRAAAASVAKAWWHRGMRAPTADANCLVNAVSMVLGGATRAWSAEPSTMTCALRAIKAELGVSGLDEVYAWNDVPSRQQHEVVALLRTAAERADDEDAPVVTWTAREHVVEQES